METVVDAASIGVDAIPPQDPLRTVAVQVTARLEQTEIRALVEAIERTGQIPRDIDKQLLGGARAAIGRDLDSAEKKNVRAHFVEECQQRLK
jgi:hypothetical protein